MTDANAQDDRGAPAAGAKLWGRLPAAYRELGGDVLRRYVAVAEELAAGAVARIFERPRDREPPRLARLVTGGPENRYVPAGGWDLERLDRACLTAGPRATAGSALGITRWCAADARGRAIWHGLWLVPGRGDVLEVVRSRARSTVVAFSDASFPSPPETFGVPAWLLAVGVALQIVVLREAPPSRRPPSGHRFRGRVAWAGGSVPEPSDLEEGHEA